MGLHQILHLQDKNKGFTIKRIHRLRRPSVDLIFVEGMYMYSATHPAVMWHSRGMLGSGTHSAKMLIKFF